MTLPPSASLGPESQTAVSRLVVRERVRAMESLAAAIAHEIRAAVLGVTSAAQLLRYAVPQDPIAEKSLGRILQESERLGALHEALSEYATELPPRLAADDPDDVWREVLASLRGALEASSVLLTHAAAGPGARCLIDRDQLARAFGRVVHAALGRVPPGAELDIVSSIEPDGCWHSTISVAPTPASPLRAAAEFERPAFLIALANRTIVAHFGELTEHHEGDDSLLLSMRLPLGSGTE
jgi:signal transduction histidine kinase